MNYRYPPAEISRITDCNNYMKHFSYGQSMVEIIIVIGIVLVVVTGLVVGSTAALRGTRFSSTKSPATKYAQEGLELARKLRDTSWSTFFARKDEINGLWCLDEAGTWTSAGGSEANCSNNVAGIYSRTVRFTWDGTGMTVVSAASWVDGATTHKSELTTYLTEWK